MLGDLKVHFHEKSIRIFQDFSDKRLFCVSGEETQQREKASLLILALKKLKKL
jgi:hypothetical protein